LKGEKMEINTKSIPESDVVTDSIFIIVTSTPSGLPVVLLKNDDYISLGSTPANLKVDPGSIISVSCKKGTPVPKSQKATKNGQKMDFTCK
jgi:hypothetical protein